MDWLIAWRNVWRNPRRSLLSAGAIGFAVMLLVFTMSMQLGQYRVMIENATALISGHAQLQHPEYHDTPRLRYDLPHAEDLRRRVLESGFVRDAALRAQAFVLISGDGRSSGVMLVGVEPEREEAWSSMPKQVRQGRYLRAGDQDAIVLGSGTARTLEVGVGDEVVILGNAIDGTVAVMVLQVVGIFETAQVDLNRSMAFTPLRGFQDAFLMGDAVSAVVLRFDQGRDAERLAPGLEALLADADVRVLPWNELMPELEQAITMDWYSGLLIYSLLALMVVFSIVNTFIMTVYERTREFGMVMAIGARPQRVLTTLQIEALLLGLLGTGVGAALGIGFVLLLGHYGIYMGEEGGELLRRFHMPDRLYPSLVPAAVFAPTTLLLVSVQLAALVPALRVLRLRPVEALRVEE